MFKYLYILLIISSFSFSENPCYNKQEILNARKENNEYYKNNEKSPLTDKDKRKFKSLKCFEPIEKFAVTSIFTQNQQKDTLLIKTSKSDIRTMLRFGTLKFKINNQDLKLTAFIRADEKEPHSLFVPFIDLTSENGKTYSAGRYLDIEYVPNQNEYCIDFNLCYNPYCAYNKKYSCPLVPIENYLNIEILAGEKSYNK
jgi:uncharacterized protein (DUF1684 family)